MERLRLAVKKDGALQFLSHLDFARAVRYVIIRAKLPMDRMAVKGSTAL